MTTTATGIVQESRRLSPYGSVVSSIVNGSRYDSTGYTGHTRDISEGLIYAQARYYDPEVGVFTSQDPMFWNGASNSKYLQNPLVHNSYGYARNNPVNNIDPNGESPVGIALVAIGMAMTAYSMYTVGSAYYNGTQDQLTGWDYAGAVPGIAFTKVGGAAVKASRALNGVEKVGEIKKLSNADRSIQYATSESKLKHIFGKPDHNLDILVKNSGSQTSAINAVVKELYKQNLPVGQFKDTLVKIGDQNITVRGTNDNGVIKIGTMFIKNSN